MKERTVVYGLGKVYEENRDRIEKLYNVVGYCDRDVSRIPQNKGITRDELKNHPDLYDICLITATPILVLPDLLENLLIPKEKIRVLIYDDVLRLDKYEMKFYGHSDEDAALLCLAQLLWKGKFDFKYLEIGCNDPVYNNNSFNMYRLGARGVLVDPLPSVLTLVNWMRPEDKFLQVAVSSKTLHQKATFYVSGAEELGSLYANHHEKFDVQKAHNIKEIKVDVLGINDLIEKIGFIPDILLVDAEGEDENILRAFNYDKYKPKIIMAEVCHGEISDDFMKEHGYCVFMKIAESNTIFVLEEEIKKALLQYAEVPIFAKSI